MPSRAGPEDMGERQPLPLYPLDSLTPFVAGPEGPDPGPGAGCTAPLGMRTQSGRGDLDRTRLWVRGLGEIEASARKVVPSGVPGLRWRFARPRPSGRMIRWELVPRADAARLHMGSDG